MILIEDYPKLLSQELNISRLHLIYTQKENNPDPRWVRWWQAEATLPESLYEYSDTFQWHSVMLSYIIWMINQTNSRGLSLADKEVNDNTESFRQVK